MILRTVLSIVSMFIALAALLPVLILILPVWIFIGICIIVERLLIKSNTSWQNILKFDQDIGWRLESNSDKVSYYDQSGDKGSIITDEDGWPGKNTIEESDIIVFGDSFAFGIGAEFDKTYYRLRRKKIKPIAAPSYNMVQGLILMKKYAEKLKGKSVVWFICLENDLAENIRVYQSKFYTNPFLRIQNDKWEIVTTHIQPEKWLYGEKKSHNSLRFATICTESPYSSRIYSACEFLIQEAAELCNSVDAELLIFSIPDKRQLTRSGKKDLTRHLKNVSDYNNELPDRRIKEICEKFQINFIPGIEVLDIHDYKARDPHWNFSGNKKISDIIYKHFDYLL